MSASLKLFGKAIVQLIQPIALINLFSKDYIVSNSNIQVLSSSIRLLKQDATLCKNIY